jgi:predicted nucleic acid-binding protein
VRLFFDTNVLVYTRDPGDATKRSVARALVEQAVEQGSFVVSTQVLMEFYAATTRRRLLGPQQALDLVRFWGGLDTVVQAPGSVVRGIELHQAHALSVWDGFIVQAALDSRCDVLLSEDLQHGRRFGGLEVSNPFLPSAAHDAAVPAYRRRKAGPRARRSPVR